jgi:hypothetical protein
MVQSSLFSSSPCQVIVAVGGEDDKVVLRSVECFNPATLTWKTLACLPYAISKHGLVISGGNVLYLAGGEFPDGSASRAMWRYDPVLDHWQEMAQMQEPRSELGEELRIATFSSNMTIRSQYDALGLSTMDLKSSKDMISLVEFTF